MVLPYCLNLTIINHIITIAIYEATCFYQIVIIFPGDPRFRAAACGLPLVGHASGGLGSAGNEDGSPGTRQGARNPENHGKIHGKIGKPSGKWEQTIAFPKKYAENCSFLNLGFKIPLTNGIWYVSLRNHRFQMVWVPRFAKAVSKPNLGSRSNSWGLPRNGENCEKQVILFLEFLENTHTYAWKT